MPACIAPRPNGSERTPKLEVKAAVLTGLSDGTAITPSCSESSFFQLLNSALKVGSPWSRLERAADGEPLRRQAELASARGWRCGNAARGARRRRPPRRKLGPRRGRAARRSRPEAARVAGLGKGGRIDLAARQHGREQLLALFDQAGALLGGGGELLQLLSCR
jgi:hypothetical protein